MKKLDEIFTIGYSSFGIEKFVEVLKKYVITALIDVRSIPVSAHFPEFNQKNLSLVLRKNDIIYRNYDKEFGARQLNTEFFTDGVLDFAKFSVSKQFLDGVNKIEKGMELGYKFALMCAEKRPEECHRCILVAKKFHELGYNVKHILEDGSYITQADVEKILVKKYFPDYNQIFLFERPNMAEMIRQSYLKRNLEIGYRLSED